MAQAATTLHIRAATSTRDITGAHAHLIERLKEAPPDVIRIRADEDDLILRSAHLRRTLQAVHDYLGACIQDTNNSTWAVDIDRKYIDGYFSDLIGDVCGPIHTAAETVREESQAA